jgi:hypothetical protein
VPAEDLGALVSTVTRMTDMVQRLDAQYLATHPKVVARETGKAPPAGGRNRDIDPEGDFNGGRRQMDTV